ncbi:MAG TPA: YlbF family regulator [Candidatus Limnocylindria bacterium]|nr:YlbF family regulator [Candidatus Limnocylindria bacterium]
MNEQILTKARELGELIAASEEFNAMRGLEAEATQDQEVSDLYDQYADLRERMDDLQKSAKPDAAEFRKLREQAMDVESRLSRQDKMVAVSQARETFGRLMDGINRAIQEELGTYEEDDDEFESSCGSGGCDSCAGCGGH